MTYIIDDDSDGPFNTKDLAELYKTRFKGLGGIDYISLSWLELQMLVLRLLFLVIYFNKLQSFEFSIICSITNYSLVKIYGAI